MKARCRAGRKAVGELEQPIFGERIAVQVKSSASQKTLDDYVSRIEKLGIYDRWFFVCHSPSGNLVVPDDADVHCWGGEFI